MREGNKKRREGERRTEIVRSEREVKKEIKKEGGRVRREGRGK